MKRQAEERHTGEHSDQALQNKNIPVDFKEGKSNRLRISRRAFLGVSAATAAFLAVGYAIKRTAFGFISPISAPADIYEEVTEEWIATSCPNCPTRCATVVRVVNGKAVRIASNPLSKVSEGETCPRSHIGFQVLYDPNRAEGPLKRTNPQKGKGSGQNT